MASTCQQHTDVGKESRCRKKKIETENYQAEALNRNNKLRDVCDIETEVSEIKESIW